MDLFCFKLCITIHADELRTCQCVPSAQFSPEQITACAHKYKPAFCNSPRKLRRPATSSDIDTVPSCEAQQKNQRKLNSNRLKYQVLRALTQNNSGISNMSEHARGLWKLAECQQISNKCSKRPTPPAMCWLSEWLLLCVEGLKNSWHHQLAEHFCNANASNVQTKHANTSGSVHLFT